ncbi:MAG: GumC family protein [Blastocatellia bacterium]
MYPEAYPPAFGEGYGYGGPAESEALQVREIWRRIRKHQWLILSLAIIVTTLVAIEAFRSKSIYQATVTIELDQDSRMMVRTGDVFIQSEDSVPAWDLPLLMKTKIRFLQSRPLLEDIAGILQLPGNPNFMDVTSRRTVQEAILHLARGGRDPQPAAKNLATRAEDLVTQLAPDNKRTPEESEQLAPYVGVLANNLAAEPLPETRMLVITYRHTDPALAAQIANTAAHAFILRSFQNKTERYTRASEWLDRTTRELKTRVEQAEQELAAYSRNNNILSIEGKEPLTGSKISQLHDQMMRAETDRLLKESLFAEVRQGRVASLPEAFSNEQTVGLQRRLDELNSTAAQLSAKYGPENPRVVETQNQIHAVEEQITDSRKRLEEKLRADYERAVRDENALRQAFGRARAEAVNQNQAAIQFSLIRQNVETNKALYTEFLQKTSQARIEVAEQHSNMRVIDPAVPPGAPIGPHRFRTILISLFLSLCVGAALALAREFFDNTIRTAEDVQRYVQIPLLAVIPRIGGPGMTLSEAGGGLKKLLSRGDSPGQSTVNTSQRVEPAPFRSGRSRQEQVLKAQAEPSPAEAAASDIKDMPGVSFVRYPMVSEAYRMLRTSVTLSNAGGPPKTILFTSGQPGEGKTTTTVNTAIALARQGSRVLVIDADLRRPMIHKLFRIEGHRGLSGCLSRDEKVSQMIQPLPIENLWVLPCGAIPPNPAELVGSEKMKSLLAELTDRFDYILIDSPPVIHVTDPVVLSSMVEGVIVVVSSGKTTRPVLRRVRQELAAVSAHVLGVVLNNVNVQREGYQDYYNYGYYSRNVTPEEGAAPHKPV